MRLRDATTSSSGPRAPVQAGLGLFRAIVRHRYAIIVAAVIPTLVFATQLPKLRLDPDTEAYVPKNHPIRVIWNEAKDRFGIGREILVAVEATGPKGIFTPEVLAGVASLTEGIKGIEGVEDADVRSIADADAVVGTEEGLEIEPFFEDPPATAEEAAAVRREVFQNPVYLDRLVSRDATIAAIVVKAHHDPDRLDPPELYRRIAEYTDAHPIPGARILIAGNPAIEFYYGRQMASDLQRLIPLALFTVLAILYACFRSLTLRRLAWRAVLAGSVLAGVNVWQGQPAPWPMVAGAAIAVAMLTARGVLLPSLVVAVTVVWTWGLQAMLDLPIYIAGTLVPPLLLAIGAADGIHILERYSEKASHGGERESVIAETMVEMWRPVVLTSVTTAAGFGSLVVGSMTVYQVFGLTTAFGILVAMVMSLTLLPAILALFPMPAATAVRQRFSVASTLARMGAWIETHRAWVAAGGLVAAGLLTVAALQLRVDYSWVESLQEGTPVLEADRILRSRHGGTMPLDVIVRAPEPGGIKDPRLLTAIDDTLAEVATDPNVGETRSLAEYIKRMNEAMHADRHEAYKVPDDRALIAQYLLLYSMSGNPAELDDMVDYDYQAARLSILLRSDRLRVLDEVVAHTEKALDHNLHGTGATATVTGSAMVQKTVLDMILTSQVYSLATAAVLVMAFMWILFRSFTDAAVCMLAPTFTALVNFGGMGLLGISLGPDKAMVSAIALGIGIDYSIHLMSRFRDVQAAGIGVDEAIIDAMRTTGRAILFNAAVVVAGFAVLGTSRSPSNAVFGYMIASNMAVSCIAALVLLPAALTILGHLDKARAATSKLRRRFVALGPALSRMLSTFGGTSRL